MNTRFAVRSVVRVLALLVFLAMPCGLRAASQAETLNGIWEFSQEKGPQALLGYSLFEADGTGASVGRMTMQGQTHWMVFLFTWKIDGDKLTQTIVRANVPAMKPGSSTTDTIVTLDETTYEHRSGRKTEKEKRVPKLPAEFEKMLTTFRAK